MDSNARPDWQTALRYGLIGAVISLYFSAIGMVETFSQRNLVGTLISLGHVMLIIGPLGAGYLTARHLRHEKGLRIFGYSALAGAISSVSVVLLTFVIDAFVINVAPGPAPFKLRDMFVNLSPTLLEFVTFEQGLLLGNLLFIVFNVAFGLVGSAIILLPRRIWQALTGGVLWTLGIGLFSEMVSQILQQVAGRNIVKILFQDKALNPVAAAIVFLLAFLISYFRVRGRVEQRWVQMPVRMRKPARIAGLLLIFGLLLALPWLVGMFLSQALFIIGLYVMMGLGLNIVVGYAGLLDLGYVAFFAFGAYTMGLLTTTSDLAIGNLNFWTALPFTMLAGVLWGVLLGFPVLRMRGDYLAIVTLGFGEIIRILALSDWLAPIEGGAQGVLHIPNPVLGNIVFSTPQTMYYLVVMGAILAAFVTVRLRDSRIGRQWMAMREDEDVAEAMGINLVQTKLLAFAIGAAFSALAGGIFAARLGNIFPHSFNLLISINALSLIIVGGMGSIPGVVVGAAALVGLPELLREFADYRLLIYGLLLIIMMLVKPEGFLPEATRKRELHADDEPAGEPLAADPAKSQA